MATRSKATSKKPATRLTSKTAKLRTKSKTGKGATPQPAASQESPATLQAREAIAHFVEHNVAHLQEWLDKIAQEDGPRAAFDRLLHIMEYHMPKLARGDAEAGGAEKLTIIELHRF